MRDLSTVCPAVDAPSCADAAHAVYKHAPPSAHQLASFRSRKPTSYCQPGRGPQSGLASQRCPVQTAAPTPTASLRQGSDTGSALLLPNAGGALQSAGPRHMALLLTVGARQQQAALHWASEFGRKRACNRNTHTRARARMLKYGLRIWGSHTLGCMLHAVSAHSTLQCSVRPDATAAGQPSARNPKSQVSSPSATGAR